MRDKNLFEAETTRLENLLDTWMWVEHPKALEEKKRLKYEEELNEDSNQFDLLAPDMAGMLETLRRAASVDDENATG